MYTTPRKVKQESRLRRTHSLTNSLAMAHLMDTDAYDYGERPGTIFERSFEASPTTDLPYEYSIQNLPGAKSTLSTHSQSEVIFSSAQQKINGTLGVGVDSTVYCSRNPRIQEYQTHSAKFPIVREVTLTTTQQPPGKTNLPFLEQDAEQKSFQLTLDSGAAKAIQQHLRAHPTRTIRRNSLDLEKFIQVFNEEQILMSSLQGRHHLSDNSGGVDNTGLENHKMFEHYNGGGSSNGGVYYNDSNSSNSLSLSSSTADSLDTVIYKTPPSQPPSSRNWRTDHQLFSDSSSGMISLDQNQSHVSRSQNNGYLESNNQFQDHHHSNQFQQVPPQQGGQSNKFVQDYRSNNPQPHQLHQLHQLSVGGSHSHQNSHNGPSTSTLRTGNGPVNGNSSINPYNTQIQPQSNSNSAQSPFLKPKYSTVHNSNNPPDNKTNSKLFPTKTYNHIKDMISSRFGNPNGGGPITNNKGVLSSADRNLNNTTNGLVYNNAPSDSNIGLPVTSYSPHHHPHGYALHVSNGNSQPYYVVPQSPSPSCPTSAVGASLSPNAYTSPQMSERKDVNTSFRKAIQQSTQKSNLSEQSLQYRNSVADIDHGFVSTHVDRANRALDRLLDTEPNTTSASGFSRHHSSEDFNSPPAHKPDPVPVLSGRTIQRSNYPCDPNSRGQSSIGLPSVPLVRENGDGSSIIVDGISNAKIRVEDSDGGVGFRASGLHVLDVSPVTENASSSSECEVKGGQRVGSGQSHTTTDSGLGTVVLTKSPQHSGNTNEPCDEMTHRVKFDNMADSVSSGNDSEWVDIVEPEIRQILELERLKKSGKIVIEGPSTSNMIPGQTRRSNATETLSPSDKPKEHAQHDSQIIAPSPKLSKKIDLNKKSSHEVVIGPTSGQGSSQGGHSPMKSKPKLPSTLLRSNSGTGQKGTNPWMSSRQRAIMSDKSKAATIGRKDLLSSAKAGKLTRNAMSQILYSLNDDGGDMTSTTGGLDLESMLDARGDSSEDDDLSTTIDTTDAHAIRRQLESLESMYTEVLKVLGSKKQMSRHPPPVNSDLRHARRRAYGSMSSLPSSVSSRPFRECRKRVEEKKKVKDIKSITRRFQRLESHVVTLARSVAHLSSEMRTQHLMVQEMESVRNELSQLRNQVLKSVVQNQSATTSSGVVGRGANGRQGVQSTDWTTFRNALPSLTNPCRVRKLTKFFGDEPPLIRIFLKKLGYEKYAFHFEQERIGIMELPYLTEDRLQKMGIPMGPRLRILQEAHQCLKPGSQFTVETQHNGGPGNLSVYVV